MDTLRNLFTRARSSHPSEAILVEHYCLRVLALDSSSQERTERWVRRSGAAAPFYALHERAQELQGRPESMPAPDAPDFVDQVLAATAWEEASVRDPAWARAIQERLDVVDARLAPGLEGCFFTNCHRLAESLDFSPLEEQMFVFVVLSINHPKLAHVLGPVLSSSNLAEVLGVLFELDEDAIQELRDETSPLYTSGLVRSSTSISLRFEMPVLAPGLASRLLQPHDSLRHLLESILHKAPAPELNVDDFSHLGPAVRVLRGLVEGALEKRARGVNILLHGAPGTGKTQLVRAIAASLGAELVEISLSTNNGESVRSPERRLSSLRFVQRIVSKMGRYIVLFDEAEDLFPVTTDDSGRFTAHQNRPQKGFMNEALESTPTVTLWTSNAKGQVDPSHLRRMHLVLRLDVPPRSVRARMVEERLGGLGLPEDRLLALSSQAVTPAEIDRLGRVVELTRGVEPDEAFRVALEAGVADMPLETPTEGPAYDPRYCQTNHDLAAIAEGLRARDGGRLLLHGAPGTGKTAWVRFLAERLEKPLIHITASTLLSKYVGETEAKLAESFRRATAEHALLFFDEADTFLASRERAVRHWEVSQVNELLVQMERFSGVFVCATNMLDMLDPASLRRFDVKVRFDALRSVARLELFDELLSKLELGASSATQRRRIESLDGLVLGDFANVARQSWFARQGRDAEWLVEALCDELRARGDVRDPIGF